MWKTFKEDIVPLVEILVVVLILSSPIIIFKYYSSCREAKIFNARYGTNYSCGDFFWARSQIQQQVQTIKIEGLEKEIK